MKSESSANTVFTAINVDVQPLHFNFQFSTSTFRNCKSVTSLRASSGEAIVEAKQDEVHTGVKIALRPFGNSVLWPPAIKISAPINNNDIVF
jgi:hypothetical protein